MRAFLRWTQLPRGLVRFDIENPVCHRGGEQQLMLVNLQEEILDHGVYSLFEHEHNQTAASDGKDPFGGGSGLCRDRIVDQ
ncbi:MAG: hypothetical protein ACI9HK_000958 [Pirellulaceae bacterium]|jgi:hypothetical protein